MDRHNSVKKGNLSFRGLPLKLTYDDERQLIPGNLEPVDVTVFQKSDEEKMLLKILKRKNKNGN